MNINPHPNYGPCDGFGPDGECSQCTGLIGRNDGAIVDLRGNPVFRGVKWTTLSIAFELAPFRFGRCAYQEFNGEGGIYGLNIAFGPFAGHITFNGR